MSKNNLKSLPWQEPEEELNKLLLMNVSSRDWNVEVKMFGCVEVRVFFVITNQPTEEYVSWNLKPVWVKKI